MPHRSQFLMMAILLVPALPAAGQEEVTPGPAGVRSSDGDQATHDDVRAMIDALVRAVNEKDVESLTSLLHTDVILTAQDGNQLSTIRGRDGVRDFMERLLTGPEAAVRELTVTPVVDERIIFHGEDTAIAFGSSSDHYVMADEKEFDLDTRWSATVVKSDDRWLIAGLHVSSNLFDNPVISELSKLISLAGLASALGGLLIGYGIARFIGRRKPNTRDTFIS